MVCELFLQIVSVEEKSSNSVRRDLLLTLRKRLYHFFGCGFSSVQLLVSV